MNRLINPKSVKINTKLFFDPLFVIILSIFSGEASLKLIGIPINLSSTVFYVFFLYLLILLASNRVILTCKINTVIIFYLYLILRNLFVKEKVFNQWLLPNVVTCLFFIILTNIRFSKKHIIQIIDYALVFTSFLMIVGFSKVLLHGTGTRLAVFGGPNGFYKFALLFESLLFGKLIETRNKKIAFLMLIGTILALFTASKGAIITICILAFVESCYYLKCNINSIFSIVKKILLLLFVFLIGVAAFKYIRSLNNGLALAIERGIGIFSTNITSLTSVSSRLNLAKLSIEYFKRKPVLGMGALYLNADTNGRYPYAHNIFLEMLGEQGIIGVILFLFTLLELLGTINKDKLKDNTYFSLVLWFLVYFIGAQFSGNILDSKVIFFVIILISKYSECFYDNEK